VMRVDFGALRAQHTQHAQHTQKTT
jgi:hypothetical protein